MPKLPGREKPTRKTIPIEFVTEIGSFVAVWDRYVQKRPCVIEGCEHIVSGTPNPDWKPGGAYGDLPWIACGSGSGAAIVYDSRPDRKVKGAACVCCVDAIHDAWRAKHGDPE